MDSVTARRQFETFCLRVELAAADQMTRVEIYVNLVYVDGRAAEGRVSKQILQWLPAQTSLAKAQVSNAAHRFWDASDFQST